MKKSLLVGLTLILGATLSGCNSKAEQECIDNDGRLVGEKCFFNCSTECPSFSFDPCGVLCQSCFLEDIEKGECLGLYGLEEGINGGGEWITVVTDMCNEQGGEIQQWNEGGDIQDICFFSDESFCYLEDLASGACEKGDMKYYDDTLYVYAEQACIDNNGQLSQTEDGEDICILNDDEFCYMSDVMDGGCDLLYQDMLDIQDMHESERAYQEYVAECYEQPQVTVCGEDGITYYNRCFMEKAGVQEETELAEVVDGECIYG